MKTVLVTGATGFLGSNLLRRLSEEGYRLLTLVRSREGWERLLCDEKGYLEGVELVQGDITLPLLGLSSRRFRRLAWQVDAVFHCAALTDFEQRVRLFRTNVEGTRHLLQFALLGRKKHFHHVSSAYIAGKSTGTFYEEDLNKRQGFNNSYEESKFNGEALVRRFAREHLLPFTIYRPSIIVGDSKTGQTRCYKGFYAFVKALFHIKEVYLKRARGSGHSPQGKASVEVPIRIFGAPEGLINLVPVDYVVKAIFELSRRPEALGKTFHLTNPYPVTLAWLTDKVVQALGIRGVRVSCQEPGSPGPLERLFFHYTKPYLPYLQGRLSFDTSNTRNFLSGTVECLNITQSLVSLFINRAIEDRWGAREEKILTTAAGSSICGAIA